MFCNLASTINIIAITKMRLYMSMTPPYDPRGRVSEDNAHAMSLIQA